MSIYTNVIFIIFTILGIFVTLYFINLIMMITGYFDAKKQDITINSNRLSSADLMKKCEATAALLKIIDIIIDLEISQIIRTYTSLNTKYEINRLTDDVNRISQSVYNSIKKDIYVNEDSVITEDYLMTYITNTVTMVFIQQVRGMNSLIYDEKK